jgi:hypothetical protein
MAMPHRRRSAIDSDSDSASGDGDYASGGKN